MDRRHPRGERDTLLGTLELGDALGPVSGFVVRPRSDGSVYVAGDTIWCDDVASALERHRPDVTVVNAGGAVYNEGDPIVRGAPRSAPAERFNALARMAFGMDQLPELQVEPEKPKGRFAIRR